VVKERKPGETDVDKVVNAYVFTPEFHRGRKRWFVDVILDSTHAVWPFLRLSLARYQPNSIAGMAFSEAVATDFVQLPPERIGTLSRPEAGEVRVTVTGVTAVTTTIAALMKLPTKRSSRLARGLKMTASIAAIVNGIKMSFA